jgi:hypothetical protein
MGRNKSSTDLELAHKEVDQLAIVPSDVPLPRLHRLLTHTRHKYVVGQILCQLKAQSRDIFGPRFFNKSVPVGSLIKGLYYFRIIVRFVAII